LYRDAAGLHAVFDGFAAREIVPDPPLSSPRSTGSQFRVPRGERQSWEEIADRIAAEPQALAIVNKRADCRALHALLSAGALHLSTWQCAAHRRTLFAELRRRLDAREQLHVVSTSLVEAGVVSRAAWWICHTPPRGVPRDRRRTFPSDPLSG
jgi:hypothetical protein